MDTIEVRDWKWKDAAKVELTSSAAILTRDGNLFVKVAIQTYYRSRLEGYLLSRRHGRRKEFRMFFESGRHFQYKRDSTDQICWRGNHSDIFSCQCIWKLLSTRWSLIPSPASLLKTLRKCPAPIARGRSKVAPILPCRAENSNATS